MAWLRFFSSVGGLMTHRPWSPRIARSAAGSPKTPAIAASRYAKEHNLDVSDKELDAKRLVLVAAASQLQASRFICHAEVLPSGLGEKPQAPPARQPAKNWSERRQEGGTRLLVSWVRERSDVHTEVRLLAPVPCHVAA